MAIKNSDLVIHADWYCDGGEHSRKFGFEQLWRLDSVVGDNDYQIQLFAVVDPAQCTDDGKPPHTLSILDEVYVEFRIFIERDNRDEVNGDDSFRVDYACDAWPLAQDQAAALLSLDEEAAFSVVAHLVAVVAALPNDLAMCDWDGESPEEIADYYARAGATGEACVDCLDPLEDCECALEDDMRDDRDPA